MGEIDRHRTVRPALRVIADRYRLDSVVGEGGYGEVFAAYDQRTKRLVALKLFSRSGDGSSHEPERLLEEARRTAAVAHPNVVRVFDAGVDGVLPFLVMELLDGQSLKEQLAIWGAAPVSEAIHTVSGILRALTHVHASSILHADLKPSNVFLTDDRQVKLIDFGISRALTVSGQMEGRICGTPPYMAPETILGKEPDERTDVYGAGVLLYAMLAGRPAYRHQDDTRATFRGILSGDAPSPSSLRPSLPRGLVAVVERAMAVDPARRFESAAAMRKALAPFIRRFPAHSLSDLDIGL